MASAFNILNSIPMDVEDVKNLYLSGADLDSIRSRIREIITKLRVVEYDLEKEATGKKPVSLLTLGNDKR